MQTYQKRNTLSEKAGKIVGGMLRKEREKEER